MKKLTLLLSILFCWTTNTLVATPQDSIIVRIDARNQEVLGAKKKGLTLKEEVGNILEKKGIVLSDSLWQQVRNAIRREENTPQRLEFMVNGQKVVIGLMRPEVNTQTREFASSPSLPAEGITIKEGRDEVKISLKEGIHVKDGNEEVLIDKNGIRVKDGIEETKIIWGKSSENKKSDEYKLYERNGFNLNLGLNNWQGDIAGPITIAIYPAPILQSDKVLQTMGSRYVSLEWSRYANLAKGNKMAFRLGYGIGIEWYNMMFDHNRVIENNLNAINFVPMVDASGNGINLSKNKLAMTYITLPVMPHLSFGEKSAVQMIAFGGYISYRVDSWVKTKEEVSGKKNHMSGNYLLNDFRGGLRLEVGLRRFPDFFFNMDLTPVFQNNKGSNLQLLSFGVKLL